MAQTGRPTWLLVAVPLVWAGLSSATAPTAGLGHALAAGQTMGGGTAHRLIHFTFDDGPDMRTTPRLLAELDRLGIKATFFFSASRFKSRERRNAGARELAREVLRRGHTVGSHSVEHQRMGRLRRPQLVSELEENERLFRQVFGERTFLFRPPFGSTNAALDRLLADRKYTNVMWNVGLADWVKRPPAALLRTFVRVLARNEREHGDRGGIVLFHDTHAWSVDAVGLIVSHLRERNCALLEQPGEELYDIVDDLGPFYRVAGSTRVGEVAEPVAMGEADLRARQQRALQRARETCRDSAVPPGRQAARSRG